MINNRHSIRLKDYDYSQANIYFVTICANNQNPIFGTIKREKVVLNKLGSVVDSHWRSISTHYSNVSLDEYIVMPDHLHGLIVMGNINEGGMEIEQMKEDQMNAGGMNAAPTTKSLANVISGFKAGVTRELGKSQLKAQYPLWQRNYYEHVIRSEIELNKIRQYIKNNPLAKVLKTIPYPQDI